MRYSTLLLASSIAYHGSDSHVAEATAAAAIPVNDPNHVNTFLEIKNDARPQRLLRTNDDERMLPVPSEKASQKISEYVARKAPKLKRGKKTLPQAPPKSLKVIFEEIRAGAVGPSNTEKFNHVLETMATEEIERAIEVFKMQERFLADEFIEEWGIDAVITTLVKAKRSENNIISKNGEILYEDLVRSLDKYTRSDNQDVFDRVKLDPNQVESVGFDDARVKLLYDLIKSKLVGNPTTIETLEKGFRSYGRMAHIIGLAKGAVSRKSAKRVEESFVRVLVNDQRVDLKTFHNLIIVPDNGLPMLKPHQFEMMERFLGMKREIKKEDIPQTVLNLLIESFHDYQKFAIQLSKTVAHYQDNGIATKYEKLLFQHLNKVSHGHPDSIRGMFIDPRDASKPEATKFIQRYEDWHAKITK